MHCKEFGHGAHCRYPGRDEGESLRAELRLAKAGLKSDNLDTAKKLAAQAAAEIKKAE